jgi:hypothetical protein
VENQSRFAAELQRAFSESPHSFKPMNTSPGTPAPPPLTSTGSPAPAPKKSRWLLYTIASLGALLLVIAATVLVTFWWLQRPIQPVVLTAAEKATVEAKLDELGAGMPTNGATAIAVTTANPQRTYHPGAKVLTLTEREINGLLNANTDLGHSVRLEFARNAINAYVTVPIPEDFPIGGGRMFRARGRFSVALDNGEPARVALEDVTIFGLSLPKAWLGGLKGENLISEAMNQKDGTPLFPGVKHLRIDPGVLVIEVED